MAFSAAETLIAVKPVIAPPSRREACRVAANFPVELVFSYSPKSAIPAHSVDIGMGGMCVQTDSIVDIDAICAVRLLLEGERVELAAHPRWNVELDGHGGPLIGLTFDVVEEGTETLIWNFIQMRGRDLGMFLSSCEGLDQLSLEETFELALATRLRDVSSGDLIYRGGHDEAAACICVLMKGSVILEPANGRFNQKISQVAPRELFGGLSIAAGCVPFERAVVIEDATVLEFTSYGVENFLNTKPHLGVALIRAASFHWMRRFGEVLGRSMTS